MAHKGLLVEEQQKSKVEAAGARCRSDDGGWLASDDGQSGQPGQDQQQN